MTMFEMLREGLHVEEGTEEERVLSEIVDDVIFVGAAITDFEIMEQAAYLFRNRENLRKFHDLCEWANDLERALNSEWADEHPEEWDAFEDEIEKEYARGNITGAQFNTLALIAFYDYQGELKEVE